MAYQWEELGLGDELSGEYLCTLMADLYQPYLSSKTNHDMTNKPLQAQGTTTPSGEWRMSPRRLALSTPTRIGIPFTISWQAELPHKLPSRFWNGLLPTACEPFAWSMPQPSPDVDLYR
jgi:hypothetical protein